MGVGPRPLINLYESGRSIQLPYCKNRPTISVKNASAVWLNPVWLGHLSQPPGKDRNLGLGIQGACPSLPDEDVDFLDAYAQTQGFASRSAVVHKAVRLLRASELGPAYEEARSEWSNGNEAELWEATAGDGLS